MKTIDISGTVSVYLLFYNIKVVIYFPELTRSSLHTVYQNPSISGTHPKIGGNIQIHLFDLVINYNQLINLSSGNLTVYQYTNDNDIILRQVIPGQLCTLINNTVFVKLFASTLHQANVKYGVKMDNSFVISQSFNEPLLGISEGIWNFSTCKTFILDSFSK